MNRIILFATCLLTTVTTLHAQTGAEANNPYRYIRSSCDSAEFRAMVSIPRYYANNNPGEVWASIDHWKATCGTNELVCATEAFFDFISGGFQHELPPRDLLLCLEDFSKTKYASDDTLRNGVLERYKGFMSDAAQQMDTAGLNADERFLRDYFAEELRPQSLALLHPEAQLSRDLRHLRDSLDAAGQLQVGLFVGGYVPQGFNKVFGNHALFGVGAYYKKTKHLVGLEADLKLGTSESSYQVNYQDSLQWTKSFNATSLELVYGQRITPSIRHSFWWVAGLGGDFITAIEGEDYDGDGEDDKAALYLRSLKLSIGLNYQAQIFQNKTLTVGAHYHVTRHNNVGGTNISGNYLVFRIGLNFGQSAGF